MHTETVTIDGPAGPIQALAVRPSGEGPWPAVLLYSDIFQITGPHRRLAMRLAARGFLVLAPDLYGRFEPSGTVLDFERDRERALEDAARLRVEDVDADRRALLAHLRADRSVTHTLVAGLCFGGHLAFRAAYEPSVSAVACFYPTTIHTDHLGASTDVDTLARAKDLRAPLLLVWGSRDPHVPEEGRAKIHAALDAAGADYGALTFDAEHAFMRDEGPRYDPVSTESALEAMVAFFTRTSAPRAEEDSRA